MLKYENIESQLEYKKFEYKKLKYEIHKHIGHSWMSPKGSFKHYGIVLVV